MDPIGIQVKLFFFFSFFGGLSKVFLYLWIEFFTFQIQKMEHFFKVSFCIPNEPKRWPLPLSPIRLQETEKKKKNPPKQKQKKKKNDYFFY